MNAGNEARPKTAIVVTSIAAPNRALRELACGTQERNMDFLVIGDAASPPDFRLEGCDFYDLERQLGTGFRTAERVPQRHYARKNLGYLLALQRGAEVIVETDDDNLPRPMFWDVRQRHQRAAVLDGAGWVNVYRYFTDAPIWPRGLPLDRIRHPLPPFEALPEEEADCPIQAGLSDGDPDVDAICRLVLALPTTFRGGRRVALGPGAWCPFNSQNTCWWREASPLLYLPASCSMRLTDIWRSFVAQRIAWTNGWRVLFHEANGFQERNPHNLLKDFEDEIPGYLHNDRIREALAALSLQAGAEHLAGNLRDCYAELVRLGVLPGGELELLEAWLEDLREAG